MGKVIDVVALILATLIKCGEYLAMFLAGWAFVADDPVWFALCIVLFIANHFSLRLIIMVIKRERCNNRCRE